MNRPHLTCIATYFLLALLLVPAFAQSDTSALQDEIDRNEELLVRAKELVSETSSVKARLSLEQAVSLHRQSKEALALGAGDGNLLRAATLIKRAREVIFQTIALAKREAKFEENATKAIERASMRIDQARQLMQTTDQGSAPAHKLIQEAVEQLDRARDNMREHRFEVALNLAVSAERLATRALAMSKRDSSIPAAVESELERTDRTIERLVDRAGRPVENAIQRLIDEARESQRRAREQYRNQNFRAAMDLTQRARSIAMRALKLLSSSASSETVEQALRLTDALIEEATNLTATHDDARLAQRIGRAVKVQDDAKASFRHDDLAGALRLTRRVREMLKDALADVRQQPDAETVRAVLAATDEALDRLRQKLDDSDSAVAAELYASAVEKQERAWEEFRGERLRAALAHTRLARNLTRRALRQMNDES